MSLGRPNNIDRSGQYSGNRKISQGVTEETLMYGDKKRTASEKVGLAFDKLIYVLRHPVSYYKDYKSARQMIRREGEHAGTSSADIATELKDRSVKKVPTSFDIEDLQAGLKVVEAQARKDHKLGSDNPEDQLKRVRQVRMFKPKKEGEQAPGQSADIFQPRTTRGEKYKNYQAAVAELKGEWDKEQETQVARNQEATNRFKDQFAAEDSSVTTLRDAVLDQEAALDELLKRKSLIPWWSGRERVVPDFELDLDAVPMTREELDGEIDDARDDLYDARVNLEAEQTKNGVFSHDVQKYPAELMTEVNALMTELKDQVESRYKTSYGDQPREVKAHFKKDAAVKIYQDILEDTILDFRQESSVLLEGMKEQLDKSTEPDPKLYQLYRAREIAGQNLSRMMRMSAGQEEFNEQVGDYLEGRVSKAEQNMVDEAKRRSGEDDDYRMDQPEVRKSRMSRSKPMLRDNSVEPSAEKVTITDEVKPVNEAVTERPQPQEDKGSVDDMLINLDPVGFSAPSEVSNTTTSSSITDLSSLGDPWATTPVDGEDKKDT